MVQGNRIWKSPVQDFQQKIVVPSGPKPFGLDAFFYRSFSFDHVQDNMPEHRKIVWSMALPYSAFIFTEGYV